MSGYTWGLLTLPIAVGVLLLTAMVVKAGYLLLGLLGKWGVVRFGKTTDEKRHRYGGIVASAKHLVIVNKRSTGLIFFSGLRDPDRGYEQTSAYETALLRVDKPLKTIKRATKPNLDESEPA